MTGKKFTYLCSILCYILVASSILVSDVSAKSFRSSHRSRSHPHSSSSHHSYPSHSGLSGGGRVSSGSTGHIYPTNSKLSGSGSHPGNSGSGGHSYPSAPSTSLSGGSSGSFGQRYPASNTQSGSASYPGSGSYPGSSGSGGHSYPSAPSTSLSGGSSGSFGQKYPASNTQYGSGGYPGSGSYPGKSGSGGHSYPSAPSSSLSGGGTSTNTHRGTSWGSNQHVNHIHTGRQSVTHNHYHYDYSPPTVIHFRSSYGMSPVSYPVYRGVPPPYVYEYRSSGNKYSNLLAGLALYNLGRMSSNSNSNHYHKHYNPQPDEQCRFGVQYRTGNYEEMAIDCRAITYFIYETQSQVQPNTVNQATVTTTNTQTQVLSGNGVVLPNTQQVLSGNGMVVPNTQQILAGNGALMPNTQQVNTVTTTTSQVVSVTDRRLLGDPVNVNPDMECYVIRTTSFNHMKKPVPCALLQEYATTSLRRSSASMVKSSLAVIMIAVTLLVY